MATRSETFIHTDAVEAANLAVHHLREKERCEVVVALTHMDQVEDESWPKRLSGWTWCLEGTIMGIRPRGLAVEGLGLLRAGPSFDISL